MKKVLALILFVGLVVGLAGCASKDKSFTISGAAVLTVASGTTGERIDITDLEDIRYITDSINAVNFSKDSEAAGSGWTYALFWYDGNGNVIESLTLMGDGNTVIYDGYSYKGICETALSFIDEKFAEAVAAAAKENGNSETDSADRQQTASGDYDFGDGWDDYLASVAETSDALRYSLENDVLTQIEMNAIAQELYVLWDETLNCLMDGLSNSLSEEEFAELLDQQTIWIDEKDRTVDEAGKEFEGGSLWTLTVNMEAAKITEARVYELCKQFGLA